MATQAEITELRKNGVAADSFAEKVYEHMRGSGYEHDVALKQTLALRKVECDGMNEGTWVPCEMRSSIFPANGANRQSCRNRANKIQKI